MKTNITNSNPAANALARRIHKSASKDGGGKQLKRRTRYATLTCHIHGKMPSGAGYTIPELRVGQGRNKREIYSGCPECNKLRKR